MSKCRQNKVSGEGGIRTHGTVTRTHDFQSCTFGRSVTSPGLVLCVASPHEPSTCSALAEREGFEPSVPVRAHLISNQVPSTARTSLRGRIWQRPRGLSTSRADIRFEFIGRPFFARQLPFLPFAQPPARRRARDTCPIVTHNPCPWARNWDHEIQKPGPYWPIRI